MFGILGVIVARLLTELIVRVCHLNMVQIQTPGVVVATNDYMAASALPHISRSMTVIG